MAALFAATHPDRTSALVLYATFARATWAPDYEWAWTAEQRTQEMDARRALGRGPHRLRRGAQQADEPGFKGAGGITERLAASPGTIRRIFHLIGEFDVRDVLPSIRVPTLVMHRDRDSFIKVEHSRYMASKIPGARYVELEGEENMFSIGDSEALVGEIEQFHGRHEREPNGMLATVLFTDICDSTSRAAEMGDRGWRFLLERHDALFRQALDRHRGREVKRTGDGFLATFDGPARAIRCAASVADAMACSAFRSAPGSTRASRHGRGRRGPRGPHRVAGDGARRPERGARTGTVKDLVVDRHRLRGGRARARCARRVALRPRWAKGNGRNFDRYLEPLAEFRNPCAVPPC